MKKTRNEMMVGLFVIVGFIMFSLVVFFVSGVYIFRSGYALNVTYDYVDILDKGAPVRMSGVRIGEVSNVQLYFDAGSKKTRVKVKLFIDDKTKVYENYIFEIRGTHILSEPHIEVTPVPGEAPVLKNGAVVEGQRLFPIEDLIKSTKNIAEGMDQIMNGDLKNAPGDLKNSVRRLNGSMDALNQVLTHISSGEGTAGKLLMNDELYQDMREFVKDLKAHPWKLLKKDSEKKKRFLFF